MTNVTLPGVITRNVAAVLRARVARVQATQTELAAVSGVSQSQLSKILRGTRAIDLDVLDRLCWTLGLDVADVLAEAERDAADLRGRGYPDPIFYRDGGRTIFGGRSMSEGGGTLMAAREDDDDAESEAQQDEP
ncbi:DNA-binding Xre family transcriptional regulator [Salana multivorans]|uniref:DNA-binding Xre family transcriptional regulator n=1 Tax=Salana multivorans TaxID=120377 RepID=A0A3N2D860_9MICO|nr:helix-turn-helix transcriptional regulator [Salana multivorans]MBN8883577.1 helix-turn-helix transcriptional regulator [Salana multivorans]OJX93928.1 MAG: hypothetical protein BGO96_00225 [Micrococcales bacterium 73-15]ROR95976.1 DNA-binding Xre family transcriptional regulator [Salana multivorans]